MEIKASDNFNIGTIRTRQLQSACSEVELGSALLFIQRVAAAMGNQILKRIPISSNIFGSGHAYITPETNAFIAKHILLNSSFLSNRQFTSADYETLVLYFNHLETDLHHLNPTDPDAQLWLIRTSYAQWRYQRIPYHLLGRYYILLKELGQSSEGINGMVKEATGLHATDIMLIGASFYATIMQHQYLNINYIKRHTIPKLEDVLQPAKLDRFLEDLSISQDVFRHECKRWSLENDLLTKYEFNPLALYPVIDTRILKPGSRYVVPSIHDFIYRCTEGIYYSTMDYYRGPGKHNPFSEKFGSLFERYVGYLLRDLAKKNQAIGTIQQEIIYEQNNSEWRSADWLLVLEDSVVQIECKKMTTSNKFRAAVSDDTGSGFSGVLDRFADEVIKLAKKSNHLKQGKVDLPLNQIDNVFSMFIVLDEFYHIDSRFKEQVTTQAAQKSQLSIGNFRYHILSCTDFEVLCEFLKTNPSKKFTDLLRLKEEEQNYNMNFQQFLERSCDFECFEIELLWDAADKLIAVAT